MTKRNQNTGFDWAKSYRAMQIALHWQKLLNHLVPSKNQSVLFYTVGSKQKRSIKYLIELAL